MRAFLTCLLISCLFFIKGTAAAQGTSQCCVTGYCQQMNLEKTAFAGEQHPVYSEALSLFTDETEEEEEEVFAGKKKAGTPLLFYHTAYACLPVYHPVLTKADEVVYNNPSYASGGIFLLYRVIRI